MNAIQYGTKHKETSQSYFFPPWEYRLSDRRFRSLSRCGRVSVARCGDRSRYIVVHGAVLNLSLQRRQVKGNLHCTTAWRSLPSASGKVAYAEQAAYPPGSWEEEGWSVGNQPTDCQGLSIWYYWFDDTRWEIAIGSPATGAEAAPEESRDFASPGSICATESTTSDGR